MPKHKIRVGITMGDPSGIGPAITAKALRKLGGRIADFTIIGDKWVFNKIQNSKFKNQNVGFRDLDNVKHENFSFGKIRTEYGRASIEYLDEALKMLKCARLDCLVTCPISKEAINLAGFHYSGHTEYLAKNTRTEEPVMMLLNKSLKISLVTRHLPLKKIASQVTKERLFRVVSLTHNSLKLFFAVKKPRIVVCGLNPHASDNGAIGCEENKVIKPAIKKLKRHFNICVYGPYSADTAIYEAVRKKYDCVIAMYHDQALIPLKMLGVDTGVNMTLGLPFVRTSPLHGTAFDIAGNPALANPDSLIAAIRLAVKCASKLKNL